jgi:hypothetical protein
VTGVLWLPPLLDALVDLHNPAAWRWPGAGGWSTWPPCRR